MKLVDGIEDLEGIYQICGSRVGGAARMEEVVVEEHGGAAMEEEEHGWGWGARVDVRQ